MSIIGSSVVANIYSGFSITGPTGPTGPTGATGPTGPGNYGLTGFTGISIVGISLVDRYIITSFSDGTTYGTSSRAFGKTGAGVYKIGVSNIGTGVSLGYGVSGVTLQIRPIRFVNNSSGVLSVLSTTNTHDITLTSSSSGITLVSSASTDRNFLNFNSSGKATRVPNTFGTTLPSDPTNSAVSGVKFVSANIFELVRGGGWTGSTGAINCIGSGSGITCTLDPTVKEFDGKMYGSKSHVYVTDFRGSTGSIVLVNPPDDNKVYGFDLILSNALNPSPISDRFSSNIKWSRNTVPCFSFEGTTCDMKISFFGLGGTTSWYASVMPTSSRCPGVSLFDGNCSKQANNFVSGSQTYKLLGDYGACCKSDGTCQETYASDCVGFFHGVGTTCGATYDSICNKIGACCVFGVTYSCYDYLTCSECLSLGIGGSITTQFAGKYTTCLDVDCGILSQNYFNFS